MIKEDDRILEYLESEGWGMPSIIAEQPCIDIPPAVVHERLLYLRDVGLVSPMWSESYELTMDGLLYLWGEIDIENRPKPMPVRVLKAYAESEKSTG